MHKITLRNSFHNTNTVVTVPDHVQTQSEAWLWVQMQGDASMAGRRREQRVRDTLCGVAGCACGVVR